MALPVESTASGHEYKVKDMSQANLGRHEIELVEVQMPALMSFRSKFGPSQPLKGARITCSLPVTTQTAVLIETLTTLGAEVRCCSCSTFSTQDHVAAAIARDSAAVFTWNDETPQEYWRCIRRALDWGLVHGPDLIVGNGGDAILLIHEGVKAEEAYENTRNLPDPASTGDTELQIVLTIIRDGLKTDPKRYRKMKERLVGVSEATPTGLERFYRVQANGTLIFPAINVNGCVATTKFQKLCGCRPSGPDGLTMATDLVVAGKVAVVCGYGDVGKDSTAALKKAGARVIVTEIDPIRALQAVNEGMQVRTLEDVVSKADIFVITAGSRKGIIMVDHMRKMKNNAIICNISLSDNAIDMPGLETFPGMERITFNPQTDRWVFPDTKSGIIVLAEGHFMNLGISHPSLTVSSCSFTNHAMAQLELWRERDTGKYEKKVYALPKHLDEEVAALHLGKLGAKLTKVSKEHSKEHAD